MRDELKGQLKNINLNPLHCILLSFWYRIVGDEIMNYTLFWDDIFNNITPAMKLETGFNLLILILMMVAIISLIKKEKKETTWFNTLIFVPGLLFFNSLDIARNAITTHRWRY